MKNEDTIFVLKNLITKMKVERLVFDSLKHEELTTEYIDNYVDTMKECYKTNINTLTDILQKLEENNGK